ncbi:uncharacterized protein N7506_003897 [Penicillium brevicompactum]|uniref:uncharacterized protein n=1 Tax=Penicillium brevicompactum TaxID=5074 RepID=UPI00254258A5|nr:uncharacterized protein N7506_003897 [Penicillium brevicompactum]KAJ5335875.1 hypothetical protein N7506_003897 [Penicillium brevicompactum]
MRRFSLLYHSQEKLNKAKEIYQRVLVGYEKALGPDDTSTLSTIGNLGILYRDQEKLKKAKKMY